MDAQAIIGAVEGVTKKWRQQRQAEERASSRAFRRREALIRSRQVTIRDAAFAMMEQFYLAASTGGEYPAHARQIFYRARGPVQERTGKSLDDQYFTQTLLPDYLIANPETTRTWDVVFDARGHFTEPHTELIVPLGTLDVRQYLEGGGRADVLRGLPEVEVLFPTHGPRHRFGAILFIEKEGFMPLFRAVKLAERFDIAIMSTKGMSVTASRLLVDRLCSEYGLLLLLLHDFDKSGFSIAGTLQRDTRRYSFESDIQVIDHGLRLTDVEKWGLESEEVSYGKSDPTGNLEENGATEEEIAFLCDQDRSDWERYVGRRVELNAFSSGDLMTWVEEGLKHHGVKKVVPDAKTLEAAFRRAATNQILADQLPDIVEGARAQADGLTLPPSLEREILAQLQANPAQPWDQVIAAIAARVVRIEDGGEDD